MAVLHVAQAGHPILRRVAVPVDPEVIGTPEFQRFCDDLLETLIEYDGAGLAAPQVHTSIRVVLAILSEESGPEFFINPEVVPITEDVITTYEGCLSVTGLRAGVDRPAAVVVQALDRDGTPKAYELYGFPAVVIQHETDHLDGVLFVDRCDPRTLAFLDEYRRFGPLDFDEDGSLVEATDEIEPSQEPTPGDDSPAEEVS